MSRAAAIIVALLAAAASVGAEEPPLHDPMRPFGGGSPSAAEPGRPRFTLTALLVAADRRVAVVNGKPYLEGGVVDGAEIVAIEINHVRLREAGREYLLELGSARSVRSPNVQGDQPP